MESLEKANKPIIIILIIINKIIKKIITIIKKIITIPVIRVIKIHISIKTQTIREIIITPSIIKISIRIIILKLSINRKRTRNPIKIIKKYPLRYKIILLRLRRGS